MKDLCVPKTSRSQGLLSGLTKSSILPSLKTDYQITGAVQIV